MAWNQKLSVWIDQNSIGDSMEEVPVELPCPICKVEGQVAMMTHIDEIPYFGEHTQVTVLCHACGWRQTDFYTQQREETRCVDAGNHLNLITQG